MPTDIRELTRPRRYDRSFPFVYDRTVPQLHRTSGALMPFAGNPLAIGDQWFRPARITARVGRPITWRFARLEPHMSQTLEVRR